MTQSEYQKMSFEDYLKAKAFSSSSIHKRMTIINLFWKWLEKERLEAEEVSYNDLMLFMKYKSRKGASQRTIQHYMGVINHFYEHLLREARLPDGQDKVAANPVIDIEVKGVKRKILYHILQTNELHELYNQCPNQTPQQSRNKVMLGLLVYQGLKTEELAKLEIKDINLREGELTVPGGRKSSRRKMKLESYQVMDMYDYTLQVRPLLMEMNPKRKNQSKLETEQLFIGEGGHCYSISNFITQLMIKVRKLNPTVLNAKQIRASVITKWLKMYNLREVQYLAGHRYISSTESFLENDIEGLQEEVQQFHPLG